MYVEEEKLNKKLLKNISDYCNVNQIDMNEYIDNILEKGFNVDRYGNKPPFLQKKDEVIKDKESKVKKTSSRVKKIKNEDTIEETILEDGIKLNTRKRKLN